MSSKFKLTVYPPTAGPVIKGGIEAGEYRVWLRGKKPPKKCYVYGIVCFFNSQPKIYQFDLREENDYIATVYVKPGQEEWNRNIIGYPYLAGYYYYPKDLPVKPTQETLLLALGLSPLVLRMDAPKLENDHSNVCGDLTPVHSFSNFSNLNTSNLNFRDGDNKTIEVTKYIYSGGAGISIKPMVIRRNFDIDTSFVFGSCRRYIKVGPLVLMGTGREGDKIYDSIADEYSVDFFMSIGDQVYFDPLNDFGRKKSLEGMRNLYKTVRSYPGLRFLMANVPTYEICDDHDAQKNDSCRKTREEEPETFVNAQKAYREYQHWLGPDESKGKPLWYNFTMKKCDFFVLDTRTERDELDSVTIISEAQMKAFKKWIQDPAKKNRVKFIVSPVPFCSQPVEDSWYGFPAQQKEIVDLVLGYDEEDDPIKYCFFLCGDVHACRYCSYSVINNQGYKGTITEIISSGLVAVKHDVGKPYDPTIPTDKEEYDKDNDFPFIVNNLYRGGYMFETIRASPTYPEVKKGTSSNLFNLASDNTYCRVEVLSKEKIIQVTFKNQKGSVLGTYTQSIFNLTNSLQDLHSDRSLRVLVEDDMPLNGGSNEGFNDGLEATPPDFLSPIEIASLTPIIERRISEGITGSPRLKEKEKDKDKGIEEGIIVLKGGGSSSLSRSKSEISPMTGSDVPFSAEARAKLLRTTSWVDDQPDDWEI